MTAPLKTRRLAAVAGAVAFLFAIGGLALLARSGDPSGIPGATGLSGETGVSDASAAGSSLFFSSSPPAPVATGTASDPASPAGSGFVPIDMFATPPPPAEAPSRPSYNSTDKPFHPSPARPFTDQSVDWLTLKAAGRVALIDGRTVILSATENPLLMPATGVPVPAAHSLDTSWTRWIVEPPGRGKDEKGNRYTDRSYWNLCGPGATTVTLYYWQRLTGHPNVTGTAGYFLDPYAAEGASWPSPGPLVAYSKGKPIGTYWSGSDGVSGFTAHGRGFVMYMATKSQPPTWRATGIAVWADDKKAPYYPTRGASLDAIEAGINWEASGRNPDSWFDSWYGTVNTFDPTLARDLQVAVMLDVGRDGVPLVAGVDTFDLPNWQAGATTPHTRHAVAIVGYNNTANPPTFSYIDTCGHSCNPRSGNKNGQVHVIAQSKMVAALQDAVGMGFTW
jgi:hypothetical protein